MGLLFAAYSGAALLLAAIGLYGALMHLVRVQRRELGVRVALGSRREALLARVLGRGLVLTASGLGLGITAALALGHLVRSQLYGISPADPVVICVMSAILLAIGLGSSAIPALAAVRLDPASIIRSE
jgi:putative ABC transport system permease protein